MKKKIFFLTLFGFLFSISIYRQHFSEKKISKTRIAIGTIVEISLKSKSNDVDKIVDTCFQIIDSLGSKLNYNNPQSALSLINEQTKAPIFPELYELLNFSQRFYLLSNKRFDPSVGKLIDIWDFTKKRVPTLSEIKEAQNYCGLEKINYDSHYLSKPKKMKIHLGAIGKGYIMQKVYDYLQKKQIKNGYINAGGDILIFGEETKKIGIAHPRKKNKLIDSVIIKKGAVVTSGDYERYFEKNGKRYHHIIDPISGFPSENSVSVTVIDSSILRADALSTAYFLMPVDDAIAIANKRKSAVLIYYIDDGLLKSKESTEFTLYRIKK